MGDHKTGTRYEPGPHASFRKPERPAVSHVVSCKGRAFKFWIALEIPDIALEEVSVSFPPRKSIVLLKTFLSGNKQKKEKIFQHPCLTLATGL